MSTGALCVPNGGVSELPGLDPSSLYCLTPNTINATAISNVVQACCDSNALQKMGGCDYCVIDQPTSWSNNSDDDHYGRDFAACLSQQSRVFNVSQERASTCHIPDKSSMAMTTARPGWATWSIFALVGLGCVSGSLL